MRKKWKRIFSAALAGIVMCSAITFCPVESEAAAKSAAADVWEGVSSADWMSYLDDDLKISQINLPGTHDSGTKKVTSSTSAQCQDTSIAEQLSNGIRFLDIRMEADGERLRLVHGISDCKSEDGSNLYLEEVLEDCYEFLDAHPTETIVMSMKKDDGDATDAQVEEYIHKYINQNPGYWSVANGGIVLKDVRKKIVLARRYHSASDDFAGDKGVRLFWSDQGSSDVVDVPWTGPERVSRYGWVRYCVQDRYKYGAGDKWTAIQKGLDNPPHTTNQSMTAEDGKVIYITPETTYFLNFMSSAGTSLLGSPKSVAKTVNSNFLNYNNGSLEYGKHYGWIIMDFATEQLARHVYKSNRSAKLEVAEAADALETAVPATVEADTALPISGEEIGGREGVSISWSCNPASVLKTDGTKATLVCPTSGDVTATLTATVSCGKYSQQKELTLLVKGLDAVFADLGDVLREAEDFYSDAANAKYNLDSLKKAIETARGLVQAGADNVSNTQVKAAAETLSAIMEHGFALKNTAQLKANLLGWYPLTSSSADVSGNHNNGTAKGVTFDKANGAAFAGGEKLSSYISLPTAMFDRTAENDNLTVSFWVKDSRGKSSNAFGFGSSTACSSGKHFIVNTNNGNKGELFVSACPNGWGTDPVKILAAAPNADTWFHLTIVMEGKKLTVYKDGTEVDSVTEDYSPAEMGSNVFAYIGNAVYAHNPYGGDNDFKGNIKDFRVYGCAIAPEQAAAIYNDKDAEDTSSVEEHLIAHYPLTADSKDASGNQYDAAATGVSFSAENGATLTGGSARTSYISLPAAVFDRILGNDKMTVSFWVKDGQGTHSNAFGFGNGTECNPGNGGSKHFIVNTNKSNKIYVNACVSGWSEGENCIETAAPAANTWSHLTITMDGKTMSLYKDGEKINTITEDYSISEMGSIAFAYLGNAIYAHNGNGDQDFKGSIRDFRIYDTALSEEEAAGFLGEAIKEELKADLEAALDLDITKGEDGSLSLTITDGSVTLPSTACGGAATITWVSDKPEVIDNSGKVTLPAADQPVADVTLTATVTLNGQTAEVIFHCSVFTKLEVDTADLQAVISSAETITAGTAEADYTSSSWQAFQQALEAARQQLKKPTGEADVDAAATNLQAKKNALERLGDKASLNALIGSVKSLKQAEYTTASWAALQTSLANAEAAAGSNDVSQAEVDAARDALAARKDALVKRGDKTALNAAIQAAQELAEEDYTAETWALLQEALNGVRQAAADEDATEAEVADAEKMLQEAVGALEKLTFTVTLNPQNGSDVITLTVKKGEKAKAPQSPQKEGYDFEGWFANGQDMAFDFASTPITADITLTAKWKESQTGSDPGDNPGGDNPGGDNPGGDNPGDDNPGGDNPGDNPGGDNPGDDNPGGDNPGGDNPGDDNPGGDNPGDNPGGDNPGDNPGGDNPGGDNPGDNPGGDNPGDDNPGEEDPGDDNPGGDNPGDDNPGEEDPGEEGPGSVSISPAKLKLAKSTLSYNGKAQKPKVTVTYKGKKLKAGKDYTVSYSGNKKVGQGTVKVTGKGGFKGSKSARFTIMPQVNKISKLINQPGRKLLVKLGKTVKKTGAKGFEITYSPKKSFKGAKKVKTAKTSYTLKNLKKGKTYYVKVRSYAKIGKKLKYGAYSKLMWKKITK